MSKRAREESPNIPHYTTPGATFEVGDIVMTDAMRDTVEATQSMRLVSDYSAPRRAKITSASVALIEGLLPDVAKYVEDFNLAAKVLTGASKDPSVAAALRAMRMIMKRYDAAMKKACVSAVRGNRAVEKMREMTAQALSATERSLAVRMRRIPFVSPTEPSADGAVTLLQGTPVGSVSVVRALGAAPEAPALVEDAARPTDVPEEALAEVSEEEIRA